MLGYSRNVLFVEFLVFLVVFWDKLWYFSWFVSVLVWAVVSCEIGLIGGNLVIDYLMGRF